MDASHDTATHGGRQATTDGLIEGHLREARAGADARRKRKLRTRLTCEQVEEALYDANERIAQLERDHDDALDRIDELTRDRDDLRAEVEALAARVERLAKART